MIKLLLSGKQLLLFIIIAWSLLAFVSYNILSAHASEKDDKKVCESYGGKWKETIRVDVDGNEKGSGDKQCQIENEQAQKLYGIRAGESVDGTGPDGEYGRIDLDMSDVEAAAIEDDVCSKNKDLDIKVCKEREEAAQEDAICDNEDADTTDIKLCMSGARQQQLEHNYDKESCEQVNGDWNKKKGSGCTFYEDEQQDILDAAEEQRKIIDEEEQKALAAIDEYNALQAQAQQQEEVIEDWGNTVSETDDNTIKASPIMTNIEVPQQEQEEYETSTPGEEENNDDETSEQEEEEIADYNEDDNQVNADTEDSSDNTDSSDSQDSSDSEDNSSDDGGDSSDSGDDSSSSDDGGDSGDSSESEE